MALFWHSGNSNILSITPLLFELSHSSERGFDEIQCQPIFFPRLHKKTVEFVGTPSREINFKFTGL